MLLFLEKKLTIMFTNDVGRKVSKYLGKGELEEKFHGGRCIMGHFLPISSRRKRSIWTPICL